MLSNMQNLMLPAPNVLPSPAGSELAGTDPAQPPQPPPPPPPPEEPDPKESTLTPQGSRAEREEEEEEEEEDEEEGLPARLRYASFVVSKSRDNLHDEGEGTKRRLPADRHSNASDHNNHVAPSPFLPPSSPSCSDSTQAIGQQVSPLLPPTTPAAPLPIGERVLVKSRGMVEGVVLQNSNGLFVVGVEVDGKMEEVTVNETELIFERDWAAMGVDIAAVRRAQRGAQAELGEGVSVKIRSLDMREGVIIRRGGAVMRQRPKGKAGPQSDLYTVRLPAPGRSVVPYIQQVFHAKDLIPFAGNAERREHTTQQLDAPQTPPSIQRGCDNVRQTRAVSSSMCSSTSSFAEEVRESTDEARGGNTTNATLRIGKGDRVYLHDGARVLVVAREGDGRLRVVSGKAGRAESRLIHATDVARLVDPKVGRWVEDSGVSFNNLRKGRGQRGGGGESGMEVPQQCLQAIEHLRGTMASCKDTIADARSAARVPSEHSCYVCGLQGHLPHHSHLCVPP